MSAACERFLDDHLPQPGIVACAIRLPDRAIVCRRDGDAMTTGQVEQTLARMALAAEALKRHRLAPQSLCWTFDQAIIHLAHRSDGALLAIFCTNTPGQRMDFQVRRLIEDFHQMPLV